MYKRKDIMNFLNLLVEELQSKVYGNVYIMETMMIESYKICIMDRDMRYVFDLTDKIYGIHNDEDADELVYDIIQQYKEYILGAYIVSN